MAKQPDDFDPFDDAFSDLDDSSIDNLRIDDADADDLTIDTDDEDVTAAMRGSKPSGYRPRPTAGQIIVGAIQVIIFAAIFLAIFLAIGFGAVFGGQKVGLVATRAPGGTGPLISLIPTAGAPAQSADQATTAPNAAPPTNAPPTPTIDTSCLVAADWWAGVQENYQYFAGAALNEARAGTNPMSALIQRMNYRRSFVDNFQPDGQPLPPCLNDAKAALLKGFDATMEAARAIGNKDEPAAATQQNNATKAFQEAAADLSKYGVSVNLSVVATPAA